MVGTDKKNENSVAVFRFNPSKSPPIIVAPDLETPGNIDRTWKRPIFRDCEIDKLSTWIVNRDYYYYYWIEIC